jgi:hypothetical protein
MTLGEIRKLAFKILPETSIRSIVEKMVQKKNARISKNNKKNAIKSKN